MRLYNTLTRSVDEFVPLNGPEVKIYSCGPTVYDFAHIGHWFTYVRIDTLIRSLKVAGYQPLWVMNITDVGHLVSDADDGEDKLEKGARREGISAWEIADRYTQDFLECMQLLHILQPTHLTKATDHIAEQIELIQKLEEKGYTYTISDGVYYDTSRFEGYSAFARLDLDDQRGSGRVAFNPEKRNQSDFALWKFSPADKQRDMEWDSPWGKGFPGWHIECSAMSMKYLGDTLDIHTGGIDHVPVHHTNEIAQSEAVTGKRFSNYWLHSNHVMVDGEKISKSLGNGIRLQTLVEQGARPEAIRLHVLESHYRNQSKFSQDSIVAAQNRLVNYEAMSDRKWQLDENGKDISQDILAAVEKVKAAMFDDLGSPQALAIISELEQLVDVHGIHLNARQPFQTFLELIDDLFGLGLSQRQDISDEQMAILEQRAQARTKKDWEASDELRDALEATGITVRDASSGQVWQRL